jgi:hypothetical protein
MAKSLFPDAVGPMIASCLISDFIVKLYHFKSTLDKIDFNYTKGKNCSDTSRNLKILMNW